MLGALREPTAGSVIVDGDDIWALPERRGPSLRARHFGFVFQDFNLLGALSAAENVTLAGITGRDARQLATIALERVGLGHRTNFRPD